MTGSIFPLHWLCRLMLFASVVFVTPAMFAQGTGNSPVVASVQPAQVTVGDVVNYQVTVSITGSGQPSVAVPIIDPDTGLSTPAKSGTQSNIETYVVNGQFRSVQTVTNLYTIRTSKVGNFTIPPASVTLNGKTYETDPVEIKVQAMPEAKDIPTELKGLVIAPQVSGNPELQRRLTGVIFVLPVLSKTSPYNGEQIRISYHLVIDPKALGEAGLLPRTNLDGVNIPEMTDFIKEELYPFPQELKFQEREIGGKLFIVAPVYEAVIASTKTGELSIDPFQISMLFSQRNQSARGRSPYDNDPFFSSMNPLGIMGSSAVKVIAQSPSLTIDVKPVPEQNRPADYAGAVGDLNVVAQVDKKQAKAYDETVQLDVILEGEGNTESLSAPTLPALPGFTVLGEPEQESGGRKEDDKYISVKKFSYTLRPTTPGKQTIPEISISTFEPQKEEFKKVSTEPINIEIAPGSKPAPMPVPDASSDEVNVPDQAPPDEGDLRYIATGSFTRRTFIENLFTGTLSYVMFLLPASLLGASAAVAMMRQRAGNRRVDPRKQAATASSRHLKAAHQALSANQPREMYSELAEGIRYFFAAKFAVPVAEMTVPEIEERLTKTGAVPELINRISAILETCDSAQYAPATIHGNEATLLREAETLLKSAEAQR